VAPSDARSPPDVASRFQHRAPRQAARHDSFSVRPSPGVCSARQSVLAIPDVILGSPPVLSWAFPLQGSPMTRDDSGLRPPSSPALQAPLDAARRLPWETRPALLRFLPLQRTGHGERLAPGLPRPGTQRSPVFSTAQRFTPPLTVAALFRAAGTPGVSPSRAFP
jgi:hypothetical protein